MTTFFTSDLHIGDRSVARYRGFGDDGASYHDNTLARRWDRTVADDDEVWVLGDVSGSRNRRAALDWISDRTGVKHLITGNNDGAHPMFADAPAALPLYLEVFASVASAGRQEWILPGDVPAEVLLSHFPFSGEGGRMEDRFTQWRLRDLGVPVIHGHVHTTDRVTRSDPRGTLQIHIGVDAWNLMPVPQDRVMAMMIHPAVVVG